MRITAYLSFDGQCQQAANFYTSIFGGKITLKKTYKDAKIDIPESYFEKIQHLEIKSKNFHLMMYDATPDTPHTNGNNIHLAVDVDSKHELEDVFNLKNVIFEEVSPEFYKCVPETFSKKI